MNEFIARKGLIALEDSQITGSLSVSGSLSITDKITGSLTVESSGSTIFEIIGSEGQLFSITDSLSGSLFAVSNVSGLPILEVFSDDTVKIGTFNNEAITVSGSHTTIGGVLAIPGFTDVSASLAAASAGGDNLGNHTATQNLNMGNFAITNVGNVDGVDVSTLKSDFDTLEGKTLISGSATQVRTFLNIEDGADVTDATNVQAAGALMDSEVTNLSQVKSFDSSDYATAAQGTKADTAIQPADTGSFSTATGVEDNADVTDTANVTAAGALMDSEVTSLSLIKGLTAAQISGAFDSVSASLALDIPTNNNQLTNGAGYLTTVDISTDTNLAVGNGITLTGDTLTVSAGTGLTQNAGGLAFDADGGTLTTSNTDVDHILINDGGTFKRIAKGNINVGDFNNDVNYLTSTPAGTVSSSAQFTSTDDVEFRNITASGNISSSGTGSFAHLNLPGFNFDSEASTTELIVEGSISSSGAITGSDLNIIGFPSVSASLAAANAGGGSAYHTWIGGKGQNSSQATYGTQWRGGMSGNSLGGSFVVNPDSTLLTVSSGTPSVGDTISANNYKIITALIHPAVAFTTIEWYGHLRAYNSACDGNEQHMEIWTLDDVNDLAGFGSTTLTFRGGNQWTYDSTSSTIKPIITSGSISHTGTETTAFVVVSHVPTNPASSMQFVYKFDFTVT